MNTTLQLKLLGKETLTEFDEMVQFNTLTKRESSYFLNSTDSEEAIDYSDVDNVKLIVFYSTSPFNLKLIEGTNEINIQVSELFVLTPESMSTIDSITLTSLSLTSHKIQVRFYGVAD